MKRFVIVLFAAILALSSCISLNNQKPDERKGKIDARIEFPSAVDPSKRVKFQTTESTKVIEETGSDIADEINEAKKDIQESVENSINEEVNDKLDKIGEDFNQAISSARIAILIGLTAIVIAIVFFIILMWRINRFNVVEISQEELDRIKKMVDIKIDIDVKPFIRQDIKRYLGNPQTLRKLSDLISSQVIENQNVIAPPQITATKPVETPITRQPESQPIPKAELFAKDSSDNILVGLTSTYMQGKSIYRLLLNSKESSTAEITICTDREEVKRRILKSSNDLLEPVCVVDRKRSNPEDLSTINIKPGKAERLSSDSWKVIEPIIVEMS